MLDYSTARKISEYINTYYEESVLSVEEAILMEEIEISENIGYKVLALQKGSVTILVHPCLDDNDNVEYSFIRLDWKSN